MIWYQIEINVVKQDISHWTWNRTKMLFENLVMNIMEREEESVLIPLVGLSLMGLFYSIIYAFKNRIMTYKKGK